MDTFWFLFILASTQEMQYNEKNAKRKGSAMGKKPVTKSTVIIFGIGSIFWIIYLILELQFGVPDMLRLLRIIVAGVWVMGFFGMALRYRKQKAAEKEAEKTEL